MTGRIPIRLMTFKNNDMNPNLSSPAIKASIIICLFCCFCDPPPPDLNPYPAISAIPTPPGYHRIPILSGSFAAWLRSTPLKKDRTVRLYNGKPKSNQQAQYAVLNVSVGNTDLQQCADAVMRLRAEFLYYGNNLKDIEFRTAQGIRLNFGEWAAGKRWREQGGRLLPYRGTPCAGRACFWAYLQTVFAFCGTLTLERQLYPVPSGRSMQIGDVFIHGGSPGHAMIVVDMAEDTTGKRIYMLAQSYMPAQDIHIVKNGNDPGLSPWYAADEHRPVYTPEYTFYAGQLREWPEIRFVK